MPARLGGQLAVGRHETHTRYSHTQHVNAQNIIFSLLVLANLIPLAVTGVLGVAVTVLVHEASELLAVANGMHAGHYLK